MFLNQNEKEQKLHKYCLKLSNRDCSNLTNNNILNCFKISVYLS